MKNAGLGINSINFNSKYFLILGEFVERPLKSEKTFYMTYIIWHTPGNMYCL